MTSQCRQPHLEPLDALEDGGPVLGHVFEAEGEAGRVGVADGGDARAVGPDGEHAEDVQEDAQVGIVHLHLGRLPFQRPFIWGQSKRGETWEPLPSRMTTRSMGVGSQLSFTTPPVAIPTST